MKSLNIGDFIQCRDKNDMVDTMMELAENGYDTDFVYQRDGKKGYWLKVEDYTADNKEDRYVEHSSSGKYEVQGDGQEHS